MKKIILLIIMLLLIISTTVYHSFATSDKQGKIGTAKYKYIKGSKELHFYGGQLPEDLTTNWDESFRSEVVKVVFDDVVTTKGSTKALFDEYTSLEKIEGLNKLDVSNVTDMDSMFLNCGSLKSIDVNKWDTSKVTNMKSLFDECGLTYVDVSRWDTSAVTDMSRMFCGCAFESIDLSNWDTSNVINMSGMFMGCYYTKKLGVSEWDVSNVTDITGMFSGCAFESIDLSNWDVSNVIGMGGLFTYCTSLKSIDLNNWDTSNVTDMNSLFSLCYSIKDINVSKWNTSKVTDMNSMFADCKSLKNIDVSKWDTSNVKIMRCMFSSCKSLKHIDVSKWDTSEVTEMDFMFSMCNSLNSLDIGRWNTESIEYIDMMFLDTNNLKKIVLGPNIKSLKDTKLLPVKEMKDFDSAKYTGNWQNVGSGTDVEPEGDQVLSSAELMDKYDGSLHGVYVWQPIAEKKLGIKFDLDGGSSPKDNLKIFDDRETSKLYSTGDSIGKDEFSFFEKIKPEKEGYLFRGWTYQILDSKNDVFFDSGDELWVNNGVKEFNKSRNYYIVFKAKWDKDFEKEKIASEENIVDSSKTVGNNYTFYLIFVLIVAILLFVLLKYK